MNFRTYLSEMAIPLKVALPYLRNWDKTRYEKWFKGKHRIYIPLAGEKLPEPLKPNADIEFYLDQQGYDITDYRKGLAQRRGSTRQIKIGKLLKKEPALLKKFAEDPTRTATRAGNLIVVISRHPYDIAGMSTGRGWTTCMEIGKSQANKYLKAEIDTGVLIAYLIRNDDKNIKNPLGRILMRPYLNVEDPSDIILAPSKVYGTSVEGFEDAVQDWLDERQHTPTIEFKLAKGIYHGDDPDILGSTLIDAVKRDNTRLAKRLIRRRANVNIGDKGGATALHWAAYYDKERIAKLLVDAGADVNAKSDIGNSPLHYAVMGDNRDMVKLLISAGADVNIRNKNNTTPYSISKPNSSTRRLLRKHGGEK